MTPFKLTDDIAAYYIKANSFPEGVMNAHQALHAQVPFSRERKYFGISHGGANGAIVYMAAAAELVAGDLKALNLPAFTIRKGNYVYVDVSDYRKNLHLLNDAFNKLLKHPQLDPMGYCLEWYQDENTCRCLVKLMD